MQKIGQMTDQLELAPLLRMGSASPQKRERYSFDFVVNGVSLFEVTEASSTICADPFQIRISNVKRPGRSTQQ